MSELKQLFQLLENQDRRETIYCKKMYIDICGEMVAGMLLAKIVFWNTPNKNGESRLKIFRNAKYWLAKSRDDWWDEIRITPKQYDRAIKLLRELEIVEVENTMFNGIKMPHIWLNWDNLLQRVKPILPKGQYPVESGFVEGEKKENIQKVNRDGILPKGQNRFYPKVKTLNKEYYKEKIERERADDEISAIAQHLENKCNGKTLDPVTPEVAKDIVKNLAVSYPQDKIVRAMDNIGSYPEKIENVYSFLDRAIKYAIAPKQQKPKVHDNQSSKQTQFTHQPSEDDLSVKISGLRKNQIFMEEYAEIDGDFVNRVIFIQKKLKLPQQQAYLIVPELDKIAKSISK